MSFVGWKKEVVSIVLSKMVDCRRRVFWMEYFFINLVKIIGVVNLFKLLVVIVILFVNFFFLLKYFFRIMIFGEWMVVEFMVKDEIKNNDEM